MEAIGRGGRVRVRSAGLSLVEAMMALAVLSVAVLAVNYAVVAGQVHARTGDESMRAMDLAQDLMEEILALPYQDPDGSSVLGPEVSETNRSSFDNNDDFHGYAEAAGTLADFAGNLYGAEVQSFTRSVSITSASESVSAFGISITGLSVTVTVTDSDGRTSTITRFVPEVSP